MNFKINKGTFFVGNTIIYKVVSDFNCMKPFPECPSNLPSDIESLLSELAMKWHNSEMRPRISEQSLKHWDKLIDNWIGDKKLPIFIRKLTEGRGCEIVHKEGRRIIPADNSPANWSFYMAYQECYFDINDIKKFIDMDEIPIAFAFKPDEIQRAVKTHTGCGDIDINKKGWKVCHIQPIGLKTRMKINEIPLSVIEEHFRNFLSPSNMFLVPKKLSGFGELPHLIEVMKNKKNIS